MIKFKRIMAMVILLIIGCSVGFIWAHPYSYSLPPLNDTVRTINNVPDTLDLASMANLSINGLTRTLDAANNYRLFFITAWNRFPSILHYEDGSAGCRAKFTGPLVLNRILSGNDNFMSDIETGMLDDYLDDLDSNVFYVRGSSSRVVEGFILQYLRSGNILWKNLALNSVKCWCDDLKLTPEGYGYWEVDEHEPFFQYDNGQDPWRDEMLLLAYRVFGYKRAFETARKHIWYVLEKSNAFNKVTGEFNPYLDMNEGDGGYQNHFHNHTHYLLPFLQYALLENDCLLKQTMLNFVLTSYTWAKSSAAGSVAEVGFFPEYIDGTNQEGYNGETCCIADMINLAIKLSQAGIGDYWDDASRWIRNHFAESQLTPEMGNRLEAWSVANWGNEPSAVPPGDVSTDVVARSVGSFAGWPTLNGWLDTQEQERGIQHCCTGNGARTIFIAWDSILKAEYGTLSVNLLLNRFSREADVYSFLPYEGKVEVKLNQLYTTVRIRVPGWVSHEDVNCYIGNNSISNFGWEGNYVVLNGTTQYDLIRVTFPSPGEEQQTITLKGIDYHFTFREETVIDLDDNDQDFYVPLYERYEQYSRTTAPLVSVSSYDSDETGILSKTDLSPVQYDVITDLIVNDTDNRDNWSVRLGLMQQDNVFGDRDFLIATLPSTYTGAEWIRTACDSKSYTGNTLATFKVTTDSEVYVGYDERISNKPSWISGWTRTNDIMLDNESTPVHYRLYRKDFTKGSTVTLGKNGKSTGCVQYTVIVKAKSVFHIPVYQAEEGFIYHGAIESEYGGIDDAYVNLNNEIGSYLEWTVQITTAGLKKLCFGYANGTANDRKMEIKVNGQVLKPEQSFPATGGWGNWVVVSVDANLLMGANTIRLTSVTSQGGPNLDYVNIEYP